MNEFTERNNEKYYTFVQFDYAAECVSTFDEYKKWFKDNYIKEFVKAATESELEESKKGEQYAVKGHWMLLDGVVPFNIQLRVCATNKF